MQIGHWKEFLELIFRALAPRQSEFFFNVFSARDLEIY